jgi:hypothetical protein
VGGPEAGVAARLVGMSTEHRTALDSDPSTLRISGPGDLLQAVPYLLGFHPQASLVIVGLHRSRLVVTVRLDLLDLGEPSVLADAIDAMRRGGATELIGAVYDDDCEPAPGSPLPWHGAAEMFRDEALRAGCDALDAVLVSAGRWWSFWCERPDCCPPDGRDVPRDTTAFAAAATYAGMVALPDRAALADLLAPVPADQRERIRPSLDRYECDAFRAAVEGRGARHERSVKRALFAATRRTDAAAAIGEIAVADSEVARFGAALRSYQIRDSVWMAADDGRLDGRHLWRELSRRLPAPYDAAPLFLFGWCSWRAGNGALAGIAAERAVASDAGYSAADLLLAALSRGLDPRQLPRLKLPRTR